MVKNFLKYLLSYLDYDLRRRSRYFVDAFEDQSKILHCRDVKTVFDCGANIGQTIEKYRKIFPQSVIYPFEPSPKSFDFINNKFQSDKYIKPQRLALSNQVGQQEFFLYENTQLDSLMKVDCMIDENLIRLGQNVNSTTVPVDTLDNFCIKNDICQINILKMDIQGAELMALQGAKNLLSKQAIDLIYAEVNFGKLYDNQAYFYQINEFLQESFGYSLYGIYNLTKATNSSLAYGDVIFIRPDLISSKVQ